MNQSNKTDNFRALVLSRIDRHHESLKELQTVIKTNRKLTPDQFELICFNTKNIITPDVLALKSIREYQNANRLDETTKRMTELLANRLIKRTTELLSSTMADMREYIEWSDKDSFSLKSRIYKETADLNKTLYELNPADNDAKTNALSLYKSALATYPPSSLKSDQFYLNLIFNYNAFRYEHLKEKEESFKDLKTEFDAVLSELEDSKSASNKDLFATLHIIQRNLKQWKQETQQVPFD